MRSGITRLPGEVVLGHAMRYGGPRGAEDMDLETASRSRLTAPDRSDA